MQGIYITFLDWGNQSTQARIRARKCPPKKTLRLSANNNAVRLLEVAQQVCYHNDHTPLSAAECRTLLQNRTASFFVSKALSECPIVITES